MLIAIVRNTMDQSDTAVQGTIVVYSLSQTNAQ